MGGPGDGRLRMLLFTPRAAAADHGPNLLIGQEQQLRFEPMTLAASDQASFAGLVDILHDKCPSSSLRQHELGRFTVSSASLSNQRSRHTYLIRQGPFYNIVCGVIGPVGVLVSRRLFAMS